MTDIMIPVRLPVGFGQMLFLNKSAIGYQTRREEIPPKEESPLWGSIKGIF